MFHTTKNQNIDIIIIIVYERRGDILCGAHARNTQRTREATGRMLGRPKCATRGSGGAVGGAGFFFSVRRRRRRGALPYRVDLYRPFTVLFKENNIFTG